MPLTGAEPARRPATSAAGEHRLLASISRRRWTWFAVVGVLIVLSFNGRWRVGRDSAAYRGLGHHLATDGRYVFREKVSGVKYPDNQDTRYPGLPLILAGVEKLAGRGDPAALIPILLSGVLTLVLTYRLFKPAFPPWLAVAATFGVGTNARFLEHCHEILSDVPFLMGVMLSLLGFDRLTRARCSGPRVGWTLMLIAGLLIAAALRPTFWVLALTLGVTSVWGLFLPIRSGEEPGDGRPRRIACGATLAVLALAAVTFVLALDVRGASPGKYEQRLKLMFADLAGEVIAPLPERVHEFLEQTVPEFFFGTQFGPGAIPIGGGRKLGLGTVFSLAVIVAGGLLVRRNVAWGLFVIASVLMMGVLGSVPRYCIMILPFLLAGWLLGVAAFAARATGPAARDAIIWLGLAIFVAPNIVSSLDLVREQRGIGGRKEPLKLVGFERAYHNGSWEGVEKVAEMVRKNVKPGQKIYGPEATVLTYLSDRQVYPLGILLPRKSVNWERKLRRMSAEIPYAIFPNVGNRAKFDKDKVYRLFDDKDRVLTRMIERGVLRPVATIASTPLYKLCTYEVVPAKQRRLSTKDKIAATQPKRRPPTTTKATTGPATKPVRKKKPTTGPATARSLTTKATTTGPTTRPAKRQKPRPATAPATKPGTPAPRAALGMVARELPARE